MQATSAPTVVALNAFASDFPSERERLFSLCQGFGVPCVLATHWAEGGKGATDLATKVLETIAAETTSRFAPLYPLEMPLLEKLRTIAREIYRADDLEIDSSLVKELAALDAAGGGNGRTDRRAAAAAGCDAHSDRPERAAHALHG